MSAVMGLCLTGGLSSEVLRSMLFRIDAIESLRELEIDLSCW